MISISSPLFRITKSFLVFLFLFLFFFSCHENTTDPGKQNTGGTKIDTISDIDGNIYRIVTIGNQVWMAENIRVTHYRNGEPILHFTADSVWATSTAGAYCSYSNDSTNASTFGLLYNWYAVNDSNNIAPAGWHVPTDEEWKELEMYLGMNQTEANNIGNRGSDEGGKLKEADTIHWDFPNLGATNSSGFTALPGGYRFYYGLFENKGRVGGFWLANAYNSDNAWSRFLGFDYSQVFRQYYPKRYGFSVRCIKD